MEVLFAWQMAGDTLKIGGWILAFLMLGKAMVKAFMFSEVFFAISFYFFVVFFSSFMGLQGAAVAHFVNYFFYWIFVAVVVFRVVIFEPSKGGG